MAPRKSTQKDSFVPPPMPELAEIGQSSPERLVPIPLSSLNLPPLDSNRPLPNIHINKANLVELKNACDDAVKSIMKEYQFTEIHTHTDIKLALGWIAVLVAAGTAGYSYKYGFEQTKGVATAGVIAYFILSGIQLLYAYYFEGSKIYTGKRKSLSKRIETEVVRISSRTLPPSPTSKETTPANPTTSSTTTTSPKTPNPAPGPRYLLNVTYRRSSNKNKSLLRRARSLVEASFGELVDSNGGVEYERVKDWVGEVLGRVVGGTEDVAGVGGESVASSPVRK